MNEAANNCDYWLYYRAKNTKQTNLPPPYCLLNFAPKVHFVVPKDIATEQIRHRFESIHGDRSAAAELDYFAGIEAKLNSCRNSCVAQYYGVKHVIAVEE